MALQAIINGFDPTAPLERAWMPPSTWYTSADIYDIERTEVFHRSWQPIAHVGQLPNPGDYLAGCFMDIPWLLARGDDGQLRVFHNTCRHKGAVLLEGTGNAKTLVCPFHAWEYSLEGRLRRAPMIGAIRDFNRKAMSLPPMGLAQWGPLLMVHPDPAALPPSALFPELDRALADSGWDTLKHAAQGRYIIDCNWKVFVDNYLDGGYHISHMHPSLNAQLDMSSYKTVPFQRSSVQLSATAQTQSESLDFDVAKRMGSGAIYGWLYPNLTINRYGPGMDTNWVIPLGPGRCEVIFDFFFPSGTDPEFITASVQQSDITQKEDVVISASVQKGLQSPSYDRGRYSPRWEIGELHFHRLLHADYTAAIQK